MGLGGHGLEMLANRIIATVDNLVARQGERASTIEDSQLLDEHCSTLQ